MTDAPGSVPAAGDAERDDIVAQLKRDLAAQTEKAALYEKANGVFEERERARVSAYQPEAQYFMKEWMKEEVDNHHAGTNLAADIAPLGVWSDEFTQKKDITSQGPLAAMSYVASKGIKRLRDEASQLTTVQESLANTMKENEELKQGKDKLQRDYDEAIQLANERQKGLEVLQGKLAEAGLMAQHEKFDFSKLTSREESDAATTKPAEPHAAGTPALETVKAEASKAAGASSSRGNPLESRGDLLEGLLARSSAGLRMGASGTQHAWLGSANGEGNLIASLTAAGY